MERLPRPERSGLVLSRRGFLRFSSGLMLGVAAAGLLAACGGDDEDPTATSAAAAATATEAMAEPTATEAMTEPTATEAMTEPTATEAMTEPTATEAMTEPTATEAMGEPTEAILETVVEVALSEWAVTPSVAEVPAGMITFEVTNDGAFPHEFVVILTELSAAELETTADGAAIDIAASGEEVGVIKATELPVGATASATFHLEAGHYALICNVPGHHSAGMAIDFEVTA